MCLPAVYFSRCGNILRVKEKKKKEEKKEEKYHMDYAIEWIFALSIRDYIWRNIERARESYIYIKLHKRCITRMRASCMTKMLNINSKIVCLRDEKF